MFFKKHKKFVIFVCMVLTIASAGLAGYLIADSEPRVVAEKPQEDTDLPVKADNDSIDKETIITWDYEYEMCKHHVIIRGAPEPDMIGLTLTKLESKYPDIVIVSFTPEEVILKKRLECYCPEHFLLKRNKDKLSVYHTAAGTDKQDVYIDYDILFESLTKEQREALEEGRVFGSFEDLQRYLEKLTRENR